MKNKNLLVIIGIALAYHFYKMYAKNRTMSPPGILQTNQEPLALYPSVRADTEQIISNEVPRQFLVDKVRDESITYDMPSTYQTFYARPNNNIAGAMSRVHSTC